LSSRFYGGTERVVSYLTEELVRLGHDVTLFASGDSHTSAKLQVGCEVALRLDGRCEDPRVYHLIMLDRLRRRTDEFDILPRNLNLSWRLMASVRSC
jgi:glycosyl transferase family 4